MQLTAVVASSGHEAAVTDADFAVCDTGASDSVSDRRPMEAENIPHGKACLRLRFFVQSWFHVSGPWTGFMHLGQITLWN